MRLWLRERDSGAPGFVAAIAAGKTKFALDDAIWAKLHKAVALIITPTSVGAPEAADVDEVLYEGVCVNLKKRSDSDNAR